MILHIGNMFEADMDAIVITTNGFVKVNGHAVMGKGCAQYIAQMYPYMPDLLGTKLNAYGNHVMVLDTVHVPDGDISIVTFPVKPDYIIKNGNNVVQHAMHRYADGDSVPGFHAKASTVLIADSLIELVVLADEHPAWKTIVMPRPGCGAGELSWENQIKPMCEDVLDNRFHVYTW